MSAQQVIRNASIVADRQQGLTLAQLAAKYGMSRGRVSQILQRDAPSALLWTRPPPSPAQTTHQTHGRWTCDCGSCVAKRRQKRDVMRAMGERTGALDLATYPHTAALLEALCMG